MMVTVYVYESADWRTIYPIHPPLLSIHCPDTLAPAVVAMLMSAGHNHFSIR